MLPTASSDHIDITDKIKISIGSAFNALSIVSTLPHPLLSGLSEDINFYIH